MSLCIYHGRQLVAVGVAIAASLIPLAHALAAPLNPVAKVLVDEHADLFAASYAGGWDLHLMGYESGDFAPHDALSFVDRPARGPRSASSNFDFIGVPAGQLYWRLPQLQNAKLLYAGTNAYGVEVDALSSYIENDPRVGAKIPAPWMKYTVTGVHGLEPEDPAPGAFSMWTSGDTAPTVWVASSNGLTSQDSLFVLAQSHVHFNWGFTARGIYGIDIVAWAYLGPGKTNPTSSAMYTFYFGVEAGLPGDANLDSIVDGGDYTSWADHFLDAPDATWKDGDFNLDYVVDGADYTIWADNFGNGIPAAASAAAVPEPATWMQAVVGLMLTGIWSFRRSHRGRLQ